MWKIFVFIVILEITLDFMISPTIECIKKSPNVGFWVILHHITNCFLLYGWIFNNVLLLKLHIFICLVTTFHWIINSHLCDLTVYVNEACGWEETAPFRDLLYMIGIKTNPYVSIIWYYMLVIFLSFISYYKILNHK